MYLRQRFYLPSLRKLRRWLEVLDFNPGTLEDVITLLKVVLNLMYNIFIYSLINL
uniref:Putative LOC755078 [Strongylocentrotus purpuratus] n=1 Tax=Lepeophtheirus salmonis TaxID=72036 RepID=A0A0K2UCC3_LEPSM